MPFDASEIKIASLENARFLAEDLMRSEAYDDLFKHFKFVGSEGAELYTEAEWASRQEPSLTSDELSAEIASQVAAIAEDQIKIAQQVIGWCNAHADKPWLDRPLLVAYGRNYVIEYQPVA